MIKLTVALPLYRGKHIAWLAIESLCRQKNINFEWELVVIEEKFECFSKEKLMEYSNRLKDVSCTKISYKLLKNKWIPLSRKWKMIEKESSRTSKVYVLQAGDCYSQPYRLAETYDIIVNKDFDYVSSQIGPFYDIPTDTISVYDKRKTPIVCGLNMATRPQFFEKLPDIGKKRGVDGWMVKIFKESVERFLTTHNNNHWNLGVDTNGLNNISKGRPNQMKKHRTYNNRIKITIDEILPKNIVKKLHNCRKYCRREYV
jgi:hypothetical protein